MPHHNVKSNGANVAVLDELLEGAVDGRADFGAFVEIDCGYGTLADAFRGKFEFLMIWLAYCGLEMGKYGDSYLVDVFVCTAGTESVQTELLVRVPLPAHC